jgi:hypothetical protein
MPKPHAQPLLPAALRPWILLAVGALLAVALALISWRGQAILLDLSQLGAMLWCF